MNLQNEDRPPVFLIAAASAFSLVHLSTNGYQSCIKKPLHRLLQIPKSPVELRFLSDGDATLSTNAGRHLKLIHLYVR